MVGTTSLDTLFRNRLSGRYSLKDMSYFEGSMKMSQLRSCIAMGLLVSLSGTCFASTGVIAFRGAIVEPPCPVSTSAEGFALHGCSFGAAGQDGSVRKVQPLQSVRSIDGSTAQVKLIGENREEGGVLRQQYALVDGNGRALTSGNYVVTLTYP
jgi:hypothetical protein